jgi:hypothetical protein
MNILSRIWYQLTRSRRTSARSLSAEEQYEIQVQRAVRNLTAQGFIYPSNLVAKYGDSPSETGYVLDPMALQRVGIYGKPMNEEMLAVVSQSRTIGLWEVEAYFSHLGIAAWLYRAGYLYPTKDQFSSGMFKYAIQYLDEHPEISPHITYVVNVKTAYRAFQVQEKPGDKVLNVQSPFELSSSAEEEESTGEVASEEAPLANGVPLATYMRYQGKAVSNAELFSIGVTLENGIVDNYTASVNTDVTDDNLRAIVIELTHYRKNMAAYEEIEALFWLAARDLVFFGTWDEEAEDWTDGFSLALNVNDTFYYASADAEGMELKDAPSLVNLYKLFGFCGLAAWVAIKRDSNVLPQLMTDKYKEARAYIKREGLVVKSDEESA